MAPSCVHLLGSTMTIQITEAGWASPASVRWVRVPPESCKHWTGREFMTRSDDAHDGAQRLFEAPFVVVSHGNEADPILNYGIRAALDLWGLEWDAFIRMPSRAMAQPLQRWARPAPPHRRGTHLGGHRRESSLRSGGDLP